MKYTNRYGPLAASLTLLLAGCGGSSSTSMTPEMTELQKAQKAAMDAADMAETKSDEAAASNTKAQNAVKGIVEIQTGSPMAKRHAEEARKAADAAMAAYNLARAEYEKAKAAGNLTAAVEARVAAEAAKRTAEAQAKMAEEKAAEAVKIAAMELGHDGRKTYRLGGTSVTSGAPTATKTTGGVERKTGFIEAWNFHNEGANTVNRPAITKANAGTGGRAQPALFGTGGSARYADENVDGARQQKVTDSDDDKVRLYLYDRYVGETTISIYRNLASSSNEQTATATSANPHGTVTVSGKAVPIMRATGVFRTAGSRSGTGALTEDNIHTITVPGRTNDVNVNEASGIYYYMSGDTKMWLKRKKSETSTGGAVTITYDKISVYEVTRFPISVPYEYMNYGQWVPLKEDGNTAAGLGIGFVSVLDGQSMTPSAVMEAQFGSATYEGTFVAYTRAQDAQGEGEVGLFEGTTKITADFVKNTLRTDLYANTNPPPSITFQGEIDGNTFAGTKVTVGAGPSWFKVKTTANGGRFTGSFNGAFFGPEGQEAGGVFDYTSEGRKDGEFRGAFGGRKLGTKK